MSKYAPIALFVYNRPDHTQATIDALVRNDQAQKSDLYIFADGPKNDAAVEKVNETRAFCTSVRGFHHLQLIERENNYGLSKNISSGVNEILNIDDRLIVLEDDLITSPLFLTYMNQALETYRDIETVFSVTGYSFTDDVPGLLDSYFLNFISTWGWGTWKRAWQYFSNDKSILETILADRLARRKFSLNYSYDYISIARRQLKGQIDSWGIYWYASVFRKKGLTLYPNQRFVQNIGFDGSGTHCKKGVDDPSLHDFKYSFPIDPKLDPDMQKLVEHILKKRFHMTFPLSWFYRLGRSFLRRR
jgi:hypothetical protein